MHTCLSNELLGARSAFEGFHFPRLDSGLEKSSISGAADDTNPSLGRSLIFGLLGLLSHIGRVGVVPEMNDIKGRRVKLFLGIIQNHASAHEIGF